MQSPDDHSLPPAGPLAPAPPFEAFAVALAFFTRLPLRPETSHKLAACVMGFAPVGAVIGVIVGTVFLALAGLGLPGLVAAFLALGSGVLLTGALHEDGLADCADALGRRDRQAALAIMRDSRLGTYGALALILSLALRASALVALPEWIAFTALICAHSFSRAVLAMALDRLDAARSDGLGASAGKPQPAAALQALGLGAGIVLLVCLIFAGLGIGLFALAIGGIVGLAGLEVARRRFGGYTGDVLGALQQFVETAMLIAFTAFY